MNTEENKQIMARNIQWYMDQRGITRQQLCDALDIKYTTLRDWLKGITYPRIGKVEAMANYFGCEKSDLIEDKDNQPPISGRLILEDISDDDRKTVEAILRLPQEQRLALAKLLGISE